VDPYEVEAKIVGSDNIGAQLDYSVITSRVDRLFGRFRH